LYGLCPTNAMKSSITITLTMSITLAAFVVNTVEQEDSTLLVDSPSINLRESLPRKIST
jgi:Na+-translocating ferredoxin:NAD+ oxidoreductase RnfE subunit